MVALIIEKLISIWANKVKPSFLVLALALILVYGQLSREINKANVGYAYAILIDGFGVRQFNKAPEKIAFGWYKKGDSRYIALRYICTEDESILRKRFSDDTIHKLCGIR